MDKKGIVIFSVFVVAVFFIAGCSKYFGQEARGSRVGINTDELLVHFYWQANWTCADGYRGGFGGSFGRVCESDKNLISYAEADCENRCGEDGYCGVSSFAPSKPCSKTREVNITNLTRGVNVTNTTTTLIYSSASGRCYNGTIFNLGPYTSCFTYDQWWERALKVCEGGCSVDYSKCGVNSSSFRVGQTC